MSFILYTPKQSVETCGLNYLDSSCATTYVGPTALKSSGNFGRQFGRKIEAQTETCSKDILEVTPPDSPVKIRIKPMQVAIQVEISTDKNAWLGFGINSDGLMLHSDAVIGSPSLGVAKYRIENSKDRSGVRKLEESSQTLVESSFNQDSGGSTMVFTRLLNDGNDALVSLEGDTTFIYAVGFNNDLTGHSESGSITILLKTCEVNGFQNGSTDRAAHIKRILVVHGIVGILVFGVFFPVAIFVARLRKRLNYNLIGDTQTWFVIHVSVMCLSFILVVLVFGLAVKAKIQKESNHFQGSHEIIGIVVLILIIIQIVVGIFCPPETPLRLIVNTVDDTLDPKNEEQNCPPKCTQWTKFHIALGIVTFGFGIYQIISGLTKFEELYDHGIFCN